MKSKFLQHGKKMFATCLLLAWALAWASSFDDFFSAIRQDDAAAVSALLQQGFAADTLDESGTAALLLALKLDAFKAAKVLIDWPQSNINLSNEADESPLMLAALKGRLDLCRLLLDRGAAVNKTGWTPLHYAATGGHLAVMQLLLDANAYIDAASTNGSTPLMLAARYGTPQAVQWLLQAGADPLLRNSLGLSAWDFASQAQRSDIADMISAFVRSQQPKGVW